MDWLQFWVLLAFFVCSVTDFLAIGSGNATAESIVKPLLMPLLLCFYWLRASAMGKRPDIFIVLALFCGFLGDTFLLGHGKAFLLGLASFLFGHIFYIIGFLKPLDFHTVPPVAWLMALVYFVYGVIASRTLLPFVQGKEKFAVILYMVCLLTMSFSAMLRCGYAKGNGFWLTFLGSLFFVASDSMLALRLYRKAGKFFHIPVMVTYLLAQSMIVYGVLL